ARGPRRRRVALAARVGAGTRAGPRVQAAARHVVARGRVGALAERRGPAAVSPRAMRPIAPLAIIHLAFVLVLVPWALLRRAGSAPPPDPAKRVQRYQAVCVQLAIFALFSWLVAWQLSIPLWGAPRQPLLGWGGAAALTALYYYGFAPYRRYRA